MFEPTEPLPYITPAWEVTTGPQWIARFKRRLLDDQRVRSSTLEAYTLDIAMLARWVAGEKQDLLRLSAADLARYFAERLEQGTQPATVSRQISSCRRYYAFLLQEGAVRTNPAASVPVAQDARQEAALVSNDTLRVLLRPPTGELSTPVAAYRRWRDHAIVCALYGSRLGVSDVRLLRWDQIDDQALIIRVPIRGGRTRIFAIDTRLLTVLNALRDCMATTDLCDANAAYCFPTVTGLPMSRQALCHVVRKWVRECGRSGVVTPSALRRTGRAHRAARRGSAPAQAQATD